MYVKQINVLICDDSALMRKILKSIIEEDPGLVVIGAARDGVDAVEKARDLRPDVITMDINMPRQDGITSMQQIVSEGLAPVIMLSSLTQEGAMATFEALELGAFDYVAKPGGTISTNLDVISDELRSKIKAAATSDILRKLRKSRDYYESVRNRSDKQLKKEKDRSALSRILTQRKGSGLGYKAVALGISTGGPKTLLNVLPYLPKDINAAVFLVQHMPPNFTATFASRINTASEMECVEAENGMLVKPGIIYLARGGRHLTLFKKSTGEIIVRTPDRPEHLFIPSVDVMMQSVLSIYKADTVGVIMTGMGHDGAAQMAKIKEANGITIAESEESAIVFGMPAEAIKLGCIDSILPSWKIADEIKRAVKSN